MTRREKRKQDRDKAKAVLKESLKPKPIKNPWQMEFHSQKAYDDFNVAIHKLYKPQK